MPAVYLATTSAVIALFDQHIGGIGMWLPPAMMSIAGMLIEQFGQRIQPLTRSRIAALGA